MTNKNSSQHQPTQQSPMNYNKSLERNKSPSDFPAGFGYNDKTSEKQVNLP
jgi:hypothetical protein